MLLLVLVMEIARMMVGSARCAYSRKLSGQRGVPTFGDRENEIAMISG
jgi:hypothetical protein